MNSRQLISKFVAQICEQQYAYANSTLATIIEAKVKEKIKKEAKKQKSKTSKKADFLAKMKEGKKNAKMGNSKTK